MSDRSERVVLVVSYFFPPIGGAGVQRALKFVKYLPEFGFRPIVLTTNARDHPARDPSLGGDVPPGTPVLRARDPRLLRVARMGFDGLGISSLRALAGWPDPAAAWIVPAWLSGLRLIPRHQPDVILSTAPPYSAHLIAALLSASTGIPWVADYRDEFTTNPRAEWRTGLVDRLDRRLEARATGRAARVTAVADYFVIPGARQDLTTTIPNGVDGADFPVGTPGAHGEGTFRLSFVGTLYGDLDMEPVAAAVRRLSERGRIDPSKFEIRLVGSMWLPRAPQAGAVRVVEAGYVDHAEAVAEMRAASCLLLYVPESSPAPSGKIFEYLATGRPILCVSRADNLAYKLVEEWGAGRAAEPGDGPAIEAALEDLYVRWVEGRLEAPQGVRDKVLESYSRRKLTGDLAEVLDSAIASGRSRPASEK